MAVDARPRLSANWLPCSPPAWIAPAQENRLIQASAANETVLSKRRIQE
jgi:hypothetical protein